jgi:hypothetical protein
MIYEIFYKRKGDSDRVALRVTHLESDKDPTKEETQKLLKERFEDDAEYLGSFGRQNAK